MLTNSSDAQRVMNLARLPARLTAAQTAALLGFEAHDIATLIGTGLLNPLGKPAANSPKYFAAVDIEILAKTPQWLVKATRAISNHWALKNQNRRKHKTKASLLNELGPQKGAAI